MASAFLIFYGVKWFKFSLLALTISIFSTAFSAVDHPIVVTNDVGEVCRVDSLSFPRRHTEAVKSIAIWQDTLRAERLWRDIIAEDSLYAPALYALAGLDCVESNEALRLAGRAYVADSSNKWYAERYGIKLFEHRLYDDALAVYKRLMALDNDDAATYYYLATIYRIKAMPYSAIAILDSADMRIGRNTFLARYRQLLLFDTRQYDRAIEEGERLVKDSPADAEIHIELARAYASAGLDSLAAATYESAYRIDTTNLEVVTELWDYYVDVGKLQRVFELEERMLLDDRITERSKVERVTNYTSSDEIYRDNYFRVGRLIYLLTIHYPTNRDVVALYTKHLYYGGQGEEALDYIHSHLNDDNVTPGDYILAMSLDEAMGKGLYYLLDMDRGVELFPGDIYINTLAALMHHKLDQMNDAIKVLRRSLKYATNDEDRSSLWCTIGDIYYENGKLNKAFAAYEKSLDYNPENALTLNNYAYFLCLTGKQLDRALAMAQLAVTLKSGEYNFVDTYAWILHLVGRHEEAKKYMTQALSLSRQQEPTLLIHYADILWTLGEKFMAETYWKKALSLGYDADELEAHIAEVKSKTE